MAKSKKDQKIIIYYDFNGDDLIDEGDGFVCASYEKKILSNNEEVDVFKVLLDPTGCLFNINSPKRSAGNAERFRFKKVSQECFEGYMKYLRSKNSKDWTIANRKAIENG